MSTGAQKSFKKVIDPFLDCLKKKNSKAVEEGTSKISNKSENQKHSYEI